MLRCSRGLSGIAFVSSVYLTILGCSFPALAGQSQDKPDAATTNANGYPVDITMMSWGTCQNVKSVEELANEYNDWKSWGTLQIDIGHVIEACYTGLWPSTERPVAFTFVLGEHVYNVLYPQPQPYSQTLLGAKHLDVVVVGNAADLAVGAPRDFAFVFTPGPNPLQAQVPDFVKAIVGGLVPGAAPTHKTLRPAPQPVYSLRIFVGYIPSDFPSDRGSIAESGTITLTAAGLARYPHKPDATPAVAMTASYVDKPLQSFELTALAGALTGAIHGPTQMKVTDAGLYAEDPLSRAIGLAAVALHPFRFDSSLPSMSWQERLSLWAGGVLTAPGLGVGASVGIVRGLTFSVGWVSVWVPTSINGAAPKSAAPEGDQLAHKRDSALFLGGGYVFGK